MASQIPNRGQLEKMSNENLIASFLALQDNIILQQNDLLQQNRDISKKLFEITSKIGSLGKENEEFNKSCFSGTERLENFARGFQDYE